MVGGSWYREAGAIPVKATRPSAAQVANPGWGLSSGLIGGVDIYQGVVGGRWHDDGVYGGGGQQHRHYGGSWSGGRWDDDVVVAAGEKRLIGSGICDV